MSTGLSVIRLFLFGCFRKYHKYSLDSQLSLKSAMSEVHRYHEGKDFVLKYAAARPAYPTELIEKIMQYVWNNQVGSTRMKLERMLDVGCGSGQSSRIYAQYFNSILGFDISTDQIELARQTTSESNISYEIGDASCFPADNGTVDFVNFGASVHWMNIPKVLSECHRVLKRGGCVAMTTYYLASVRTASIGSSSDTTARDQEWMRLFQEWMAKSHLHPANQLSIDGLRRIFEMIKNPSKSRIDGVSYEIEFSLQELRQLFSSVGDYHTFMRENQPKNDPLDDFMEKIIKFLKVEKEAEDEIRVWATFTFPTIVFTKEKD